MTCMYMKFMYVCVQTHIWYQVRVVSTFQCLASVLNKSRRSNTSTSSVQVVTCSFVIQNKYHFFIFIIIYVSVVLHTHTDVAHVMYVYHTHTLHMHLVAFSFKLHAPQAICFRV